ncbi:MAG: aminotransferase class I/II-fold pyridoxal phosphate-dependent enzyme [Gammaproteobacteria bacterium]|nr:aminotransferase class I/II-fold pyridoxal phosphate-dependent enzyme [Gammaproteobacteria bacterium]
MAFRDEAGTGERPGLLALSPETMRALGYRAVDALVEHYTRLDDGPVVAWSEPGAGLAEPLPAIGAAGREPMAALDSALERVLGPIMQLTHPRFFAYIPGPSNYVSAIAELLASGLNVFAGTARHNLGPYTVECDVVRWLCEVVGLGAGAGGLLVSGGSVANLTAMAVARHRLLGDRTAGAVIYVTTQTHSCVERAAFVLGFADVQVRRLEPDADLRMSLPALAGAIAADRAAGRRPFMVVGSAGTTNTGAVDPLADIAALCAREGLWLHVDAAYGGGALLAPRVRERFTGIERADSVALDPHKWLFQPIECGCVLVRDPAWLWETFHRLPEYLKDTDAGPGQLNYRDLGLQVTRGFRAFKLWLSLQVFGTDAFRRAVEHGLAMACEAERLLRGRPGWEVVTPATLGVLTFRRVEAGLDATALDALNGRLAEAVTRSGFAFLSTTVVHGKRVIRICPIHPETVVSDLEQTFARLDTLASAGTTVGAETRR